MTWQGFNTFPRLRRLGGVAREKSVVASALRATRRRSFLGRAAFVMIVVIPTACAAFYYLLMASPRYVSEAQFIVRGVSSSHVSGLDALFSVFGISRAVDDTNVVGAYISSRDAVRDLQRRLPLRDIFARKEGDYFARFPRFWEDDNFESLYRYYLQRVSVVNDSSKGISTLRVITFRPDDSQKIASALLVLAEDMANRMNARSQRDTIASTQKEVDDAEQKVVFAQSALTDFRNSSLLIDPSKKSDSELQTTAQLWSDLTATLAQIRTNSILSPSAPGDLVLSAKVDAIRDRLAAERDKVRMGEALGVKVSHFESLSLAQGLADKTLSAAVDSLEAARLEARRQQLYVDEIASPDIADESTEPQRWRMIATVFVFAFAIFSVLWILSVGAQEHKQ